MCLSEEITIAIFGDSCTGKTTFVKYLANKYSYHTRHCGDLVRVAARSAEVDVSKLSAESHSRVDSETVRWVKTAEGPKLVEGRYLNYVLAESCSALVLVRFLSDIDTRVQRSSVYNSSAEARYALFSADASDGEFRNRLYRGVDPLQANHTIDTSGLSMDGIENELRRLLS